MRILFIMSGLTFVFNSFCQSDDLLNLTLGASLATKEIWTVYPKETIGVINAEDKTQFTKSAIVMSDAKKSWGTLLVVMVSTNKYYIASFAPLLNGKLFDGRGEFYLYENVNDKMIQLIHHIGPIYSGDPESNMEYFDNKEFAVAIKDKMEVQFFKFKGYIWGLPKNYYDYSKK